jgi:probable phosphoglycerate mutase
VRSLQVALVRHAPTAWNAERRAQGRADPPLSTDGMARATAWRVPPDLAALDREGRLGWAASPLRRALETARHLGARGLVVEPRLAERDYGEWTGLPLADVGARTPEAGWTHAPPGGESPAGVLARVRGWLDEVAAGSGPEVWLAVSHSGVIRILLAAALRWDLRDPAPVRLLPERLHRIRRRGDGLLQVVSLNEPLA